MRRIAFVLIVSLALGGLSESSANDRSISGAAVEHTGLKVEWLTQVQTGIRGSIEDLHMNVNENKATTYFELSFSLGREVISERDLDAFGKSRGIEGAQEYAELRQEIIQKELEARNFKDTEVTIQKFVLPETSLYTITTDGFITAINADTGSVRWTAEIDTRRSPKMGIGSNDMYVAAVNGSSVFCLDAATGKILFSKACGSSPSASPAVSEDYVYVPLTNGRVEVFSIEGKGIGSQQYVGSTRAVARPIVTEKSVAWPTTSGHLNVAMHRQSPTPARKAPVVEEEPGRLKTDVEKAREKAMEEIRARIRIRESVGGITYRLAAADQFVSAATHKSGMLFVCSLHGFVYAIDEAKGSILWTFSTGEEIESPPVPIGNHLFVVTTDNSLYKLKAKTGEIAEGWDEPLPKIAKYVGASKDKLYVKDSMGNLVVLDQVTGQRQGQVAASGVNLVYQNSLSDRLYLGNRNGLIQCLRETASRIPYFHSADFAADLTGKPGAEPGAEGVMEAGDEDDPFAGFDKSDDPGAGDDNPFGGNDDDNPFGGGADTSGDDNPFGGGGGGSDDNSSGDDNPFGGGGSADDDDDNPFGGGGGI